MKKVSLNIRKHTKAFALALGLLGATAYCSMGGHRAMVHMARVSYAFVGLGATLKTKGIYDKLDDNNKAFVDALDSILKDFDKGEKGLDQAALDAKFEDFKKEFGKGLDDEKMKEFNEMVESVKKHATELQKLKEKGFSNEEYLPFGQAIRKALDENKEVLKKMVEERKGGSFDMRIKAAAAMGISSNIQASAQPYMPVPQVQQGLHEVPRNTPFILDYCDVESTASALIVWFNKVNREDGTAFISEGTLKPLSDFEIESETSKPKKVAHAFNVSEEMLMDVPFIEGEIRKEGLRSIQLKIEDGILNGDGTGDNLKGITNYATAYALPSLNASVADANEYDALLAAHTQLTTLNFNPNVVFVHPVTRFKLRTLKDNQNRYLLLPSSDTNATTIDGLPMVAKNQIDVGKFLMADMTKSHVRFVMDITIKVGYNGDDFQKNKVTFLVEARLHHYISDVEKGAFIYSDFDTVKAALEAAV